MRKQRAQAPLPASMAMARRAAHHAEWMKLDPSERGAWIQLLATHRRVTQRLDEALAAEHGLSLSEWDALVHLPTAAPGSRMRDLADRLLLSPSGLTRLVARLAERGLVDRRRGEEDARETYVHVTARGQEALAKAAPTHNRELRAHFLDALTRAECETLAAILGKVAKARARCERHPEDA